MERSLLVLIIIVVLFYLETLLSQTESKYPGLVIPIAVFIASIIITLLMATEFNILKLLFTLVFVNIPTIILALIYRAKRKKITK